MNEKYILEKKGEKASIYLRLFLITVFSLGVIIGILVQNEVPKILGNYVIGISIAFPCSYPFIQSQEKNTILH